MCSGCLHYLQFLWIMMTLYSILLTTCERTPSLKTRSPPQRTSGAIIVYLTGPDKLLNKQSSCIIYIYISYDVTMMEQLYTGEYKPYLYMNLEPIWYPEITIMPSVYPWVSPQITQKYFAKLDASFLVSYYAWFQHTSILPCTLWNFGNSYIWCHGMHRHEICNCSVCNTFLK